MTDKHFLVFGSHPELSLAEARAVLGEGVQASVGPTALFDQTAWDGESVQQRLSGIVKLGDVAWEGSVTELDAERVSDLIVKRHGEGRIEFACTVYGARPSDRPLARLGMEVKGLLKEKAGVPIRLVTGEHGEVAPAAVAKAKLTTKGYDVVVGIERGHAWIGFTTHVQDATAWSTRDYGRPFRDTATGMLPPKLARLMVNLAIGATCPSPKETVALLDPFCGGGTVLMEAAMVCPKAAIVGSDMDAGQVKGSEQNNAWLKVQGIVAKEANVRVLHSSAETLDKPLDEGSVFHIVTEGFLGKPLSGRESESERARRMEEVRKVWLAALPVLCAIQKAGGRLVVAWPEYVTGTSSDRLDLTDEVLELGYRVFSRPMRYARSDQRVARWIAVFERI